MNYTAVQAGTNEVGAASEWDESLGYVQVGDGIYGGLRFQLSSTSILPLAGTITLVADESVTPTDDLRIYYATESSPSAWSSSNQPVSANRVQVGTFRTRGVAVASGQEIEISLKLSWISRNIGQMQEASYFNGFLNFVLESSSSFKLRDLSDDGDEPVLTFSQNTVVHTERFSVSGRQVGERWAVSPRSGQPFPISAFVRDGEQRNLYVPAKEADQPGRRDTRAHGRREREPRMWPRI